MGFGEFGGRGEVGPGQILPPDVPSAKNRDDKRKEYLRLQAANAVDAEEPSADNAAAEVESKTDRESTPEEVQAAQLVIKENPDLTDEQRKKILEQPDTANQMVQAAKKAKFLGINFGALSWKKAGKWAGEFTAGGVTGYVLKKGLIRAIGGAKTLGTSIAVGAAVGGTMAGGRELYKELKNKNKIGRYEESLMEAEKKRAKNPEEYVKSAGVILRDMLAAKVDVKEGDAGEWQRYNQLKEKARTIMAEHFSTPGSDGGKEKADYFEKVVLHRQDGVALPLKDLYENRELIEQILEAKANKVRWGKVGWATARGAVIGAAGAYIGAVIADKLHFGGGHTASGSGSSVEHHGVDSVGKSAAHGLAGTEQHAAVGPQHVAPTNIEAPGSHPAAVHAGETPSATAETHSGSGHTPAAAEASGSPEDLKMHKTISHTVAAELQKNANGEIPKELLHDKKFMSMAVNEISKSVAAENQVEIIGHHGHAGHIHVETKHLDTKMQEGTVLHHFEKSREVLKKLVQSYQEHHHIGGAAGSHIDTAMAHDAAGAHVDAAGSATPDSNIPSTEHGAGNAAAAAASHETGAPKSVATPTPEHGFGSGHTSEQEQAKSFVSRNKKILTWVAVGIGATGAGIGAYNIYRSRKNKTGQQEQVVQSPVVEPQSGARVLSAAPEVRTAQAEIRPAMALGAAEVDSIMDDEDVDQKKGPFLLKENNDEKEKLTPTDAKEILLGNGGPLKRLFASKEDRESARELLGKAVESGDPSDIKAILQLVIDKGRDELRTQNNLLASMRRIVGEEKVRHALSELKKKNLKKFPKAFNNALKRKRA